MRVAQVAMFAGAVLVLLASLLFVGSMAGDALWRAGVALLLADGVCILLWPGQAAAR